MPNWPGAHNAWATASGERTVKVGREPLPFALGAVAGSSAPSHQRRSNGRSGIASAMTRRRGSVRASTGEVYGCPHLTIRERFDTVASMNSSDASTVHRRRGWTHLVLSLSLLVIGLDNTILNVALPELRTELGASASQMQWIVDAYMLVFAGFLLTAGSIGDRFGRRRALTAGLVLFGTGSALAAASGTAGQLIASRALMGVGGALIMPCTLSILINVFPAAERAKAIAAWAAVAGLGVAIGPVTGGWLLEHGSWHLVFLVNVPFVVGMLPLSRFLVPESRDPARSALAPLGAVLSTAGLGTLLYGIIEAPVHGWTDARTLTAFAAGIAIVAAFAAWELRAPSPMLDLALLRDRRFTAASAAVALMFFALFGAMFLLTQYLQAVL